MSDIGVNLRVLFCLIASVTLVTDIHALERRRDQFTKLPGYYVIPMPYSLPGIGDGALVAGAFNNVADTHTDLIGYALAGDLEGGGFVATDMHVIPERLIADINVSYLTRGTVTSYGTRGMAGDRHDYSLIDLQDNKYYAARLTGTWFERMLELYVGALDSSTTLEAVRDKDGNLVQDAQGTKYDSSTIYTLGLRLDWTDDYVDPRRGLRYQLARWWTEQDDVLKSEYYQLEHNLTAYLPIGKLNTWVFNYFRGDAHVTRQGATDFATVEANLGLDCSAAGLTAEQRYRCEQVVNNTLASNQHGTVGGLGGWTRLRSYPSNRYVGAHSRFYGTEFRWNLTEEFSPFDIVIAKDVRTTVQLAFFYERGSVEDLKSKLGDIWRDTYGLGARIVTVSGMVFRADYATGDEGPEVSVIIGYPWESF